MERLRERKIAAEHDYLVCLRAIYAPRFACETDGYVFDEQHFTFGMLFGKDTPVKDARTSMDVYRKLIVVAHPDRCDAPWASSVAQTINDTEDRGDVALLREMDAFYEKHGTFEGYERRAEAQSECIEEEALEVQNERMCASLWYVWFFDNACGAKSMLQKCFVAPNVYAQRAAEREKEASARAVLNDMRANIDEMSRRYSDMSEAYFAALKEKDYGRSKSVSSALDALFEELQARRKEHDMYREQHGMRTDMSASIHRIFEKYK